ncbi:WecB/TagA/CpsF family glycosyltransferase [Jeotgalibacillus haloalkalitolerans]|uniref:WecB/TagA/CpsF family glycosyltransferase n=1 Tax=Jeotgalibacillus haloalkalitolerans TaxID=3104292 RepID=UPI002ACC1651|nr:WecB/TagA/CpsF family glycosyltransferase [Jeotgalibacillus sp. HH7-29]
MNSLNKINILNIPFIKTTNKRLLTYIKEEHIDKKKQAFIITANPEIVMHADRDPAYKKIVHSADCVVPDGIGIIYASKILGQPLPERIAGFDLLHDFLRIAADQQKSVFLYGAKPEVIQKAVANLKKQYPQLIIAGYEDGYHSYPEQVAERVKNTEADFVFVGTGFPRQEQWINTYRHLFPHTIAMGVGGSFDVLSGETKRAPGIFIRLNLEWFYRLVTQPKRIGRMMALPLFLMNVIAVRILRRS